MTQQIPSGRELEILKIPWELGPSSVRQVHQRMCPHGELAFNTIQTLLRIMDEKGLVTHRDEGHTFIYTPVHSRDREAARFLDHVFDGAMDQFVLSLLNSKKASPKELKQLEAIIADARQRKRRGKKKGG